MDKQVILLGAGSSVKEGIRMNLFEKIKDKNVWSLNFAYLTLPFLPRRQLWIDASFFNNNIDSLQELSRKGVGMYAKYHTRQARISDIHQYQVTKERKYYQGKEGISKNLLFIGEMGLTGIFALSLAIAEGYGVIFVLGFDFGGVIPGSNQTHYYQNDIQVISAGVGRPEIYLNKQGMVRNEVKDFEVFAREETDVKIYNVSPQSNIPYFEKIDYETFFNKIK